jgi:hypothetical protein
MVMLFSKFRSVTFSTLLLLPVVFSPQSLWAQTPTESQREGSDSTIEMPNSEQKTPDPTLPTPDSNRPASNTDNNQSSQSLRPDNLLSLSGGKKLMNQADQAIDQQNYDVAKQKLQSARRVFNQLSNFYQQLSGSFQGIDNRISQQHRQKAVESAQMRDRATYQLALVHRAQKEMALAVPLLVQVIQSQNPTSELGKKSYQQLRELGFVDSPFPGSNNSGNNN